MFWGAWERPQVKDIFLRPNCNPYPFLPQQAANGGGMNGVFRFGSRESIFIANQRAFYYSRWLSFLLCTLTATGKWRGFEWRFQVRFPGIYFHCQSARFFLQAEMLFPPASIVLESAAESGSIAAQLVGSGDAAARAVGCIQWIDR